MVSVWDDRLAEVWAAPGRAGAGVVVGAEAVLTARHLVKDALGAGRVLARAVRPGVMVAPWTRMRVAWQNGEWDLAVLVVDHSRKESRGWQPPRSAVAVVRLGTAAEPGCEAVGFPESAVQLSSAGAASEAVRQTEQVRGTVLPAGQGKPPVSLARQLPARWMPLDVDTTTPGTQAGWGVCPVPGWCCPDWTVG